MALLRPRKDRSKRAARLRAHGALRCPFNGHQVSWCRQLCEPIEDHGYCGRLAPHTMVGKTQVAIASYRDRPLKTRT
jgi:hypothetical protein